jgi:DNA-binding XRE family transcriptional regulator
MTPATFKAIRNRLGWSQARLGQEVGVGGRHIRMIEAGDRQASGPLVVLMQKLNDEALGEAK